MVVNAGTGGELRWMRCPAEVLGAGVLKPVSSPSDVSSDAGWWHWPRAAKAAPGMNLPPPSSPSCRRSWGCCLPHAALICSGEESEQEPRQSPARSFCQGAQGSGWQRDHILPSDEQRQAKSIVVLILRKEAGFIVSSGL